MTSILAIGAHPDDIEFGAGGTLIKHYDAAGDKVSMLVLSRGARGGEGQDRISEAKNAAALVGAEFFQGNLEDTLISDGAPTINVIESVVDVSQPDVVYIHTGQDRHQDHRNAFLASLVACREVAKVYGYQSPSATTAFHPTRFIGIDDYLTGKIAMIGVHVSQVSIRDYLDESLVRATARYWGQQARSSQQFAEPFEVVHDREFDFVK